MKINLIFFVVECYLYCISLLSLSIIPFVNSDSFGPFSPLIPLQNRRKILSLILWCRFVQITNIVEFYDEVFQLNVEVGICCTYCSLTRIYFKILSIFPSLYIKEVRKRVLLSSSCSDLHNSLDIHIAVQGILFLNRAFVFMLWLSPSGKRLDGTQP